MAPVSGIVIIGVVTVTGESITVHGNDAVGIIEVNTCIVFLCDIVIAFVLTLVESHGIALEDVVAIGQSNDFLEDLDVAEVIRSGNP